MKVKVKAKGDTGSQEQISPQKELKGTEGSYIEPLPGEVMSKEEQIKEYEQSFGDIDDLLDDIEIGDDIFEETVNKPQVREDVSDPNKPKETITPDAREKKAAVESDEEDEYEEVEEQPQLQDGDDNEEYVDLDQYTPKSEYESLQKKFNDVQGELNNLKGKVNPALEKLEQEDIRIINQVYHDIQNTPLGIIADMYYKGELNLNDFISDKPISKYMPEGEEYIQEDAVNRPDSPSWQARIKWETERANRQQKIQVAGKSASAEIKNNSKQLTPEEQEVKEKEMFESLEKKVPQSSKFMPVFKKWFDQQENLLLPLYFAFAHQMKNAKRGGADIKASVESVAQPSVRKSTKRTVDDTMRDEFGD